MVGKCHCNHIQSHTECRGRSSCRAHFSRFLDLGGLVRWLWVCEYVLGWGDLSFLLDPFHSLQSTHIYFWVCIFYLYINCTYILLLHQNIRLHAIYIINVQNLQYICQMVKVTQVSEYSQKITRDVGVQNSLLNQAMHRWAFLSWIWLLKSIIQSWKSNLYANISKAHVCAGCLCNVEGSY